MTERLRKLEDFLAEHHLAWLDRNQKHWGHLFRRLNERLRAAEPDRVVPLCPYCGGPLNIGIWGSGYFEAICVKSECRIAHGHPKLYGLIGQAPDHIVERYRTIGRFTPVLWACPC